MRLLLISNSTMAGEPFLQYPLAVINDFLGTTRKVLFVPYAGVTISWDDYYGRVAERLSEIGVSVEALHQAADPVVAVAEAEAIVVGGGNTFHLLAHLQSTGVQTAIQQKVRTGVPFVGWSAGANVACPTITTTNDMPIVQPQSFEALCFVPFQINPHYIDVMPQGHAGESRRQRIAELLIVNPQATVVGLPEGSMLRVEDAELKLLGQNKITVFRSGQEICQYSPEEDIRFLLRTNHIAI